MSRTAPTKSGICVLGSAASRCHSLGKLTKTKAAQKRDNAANRLSFMQKASLSRQPLQKNRLA
nr:MAG TPA: hypothetical protein [Caudoviricetes sp.]